MTLRRSSVIFASGLALIAIMVAATLIMLTRSMHRASEESHTSVDSLARGDEIALSLVSLRDQDEPAARAVTEERLRSQLEDAARLENTVEDKQILLQLRQRIDGYVEALRRATGSPEEVERATVAAYTSALDVAREWVELNVAQSLRARNEAARSNELANLLGIAAIVLVFGGLGGLAWWLGRMTVRPTLALVGVIDRYARGERSARASEHGPEELRTIAHGFNDMAVSLQRQQTGQLVFLAGVAHDLRNPLSALKLATAMISPDQPLPPEPRVRQLFGRVQRQIDRLDRMVYDLLDASQIEAGRLELRLEDCDVRELVRTTIDLFDSNAASHQLVASLPDEPVYARCDPARIEQVLTNLVSNALKYSPNGGTVTLAVSRRDERAVLAVSDQGLGIAAGELEHVFEPFRRCGSSQETIAGVGLGLFVVRKIVEAHGGKVSVESELDKGSTFELQLPLRAVT